MGLGLISDKWKKVKLGSLGDIITGKTPKTNDKENYGNDVLFLTPSDNMELRYIKDTIRKLSLKGAETVQNKILPKESICVSCIGSQLGKVVITTEDTVTNQQINSIIPNDDVDYKYLYYTMLLVGNKLNFLSKTSTAVPIINKTEFSNQEIYLPPLEEQKSIVDLLSSFDDKIENNNAIIANLEEQVQAIYKSWFVDFEPFLEEEFVDSELGKTPKSWKVVKLGDVSKEIVTGKTPSTKVPENYGDKMPFVTIPDMHDRVYVTKTERSLSDKGFKTQEKKIVPKNSIAVSCIATVGLVTLIAEDSITNQQINTVKPKEKTSLYYLYSYLKTQSDFLNAIGSSGSTTKNVNKTTFSNLKLLLPSVEVLEKYHKLCEPIFDYILLIQKQNEKLIRTRDTLLPKLMLGEIRVEEAVEIE